jgi:dolichol-phosphate mannosyltransferase
MKVFLTLPAYNEESGLAKLLEAFANQLKTSEYSGQVTVVDDGSKDRTREVARDWSAELPLDIVEHPVNRGLGETIRDALRRSAELAQPDDIIVTMDADNTHSVDLIPRMVELISSGKDLVIASRYRKGARVIGLSPFRQLTSYGARALFQVALPIPGVRDYTSGFRAYRASLVQTAFAMHGDSLVTESSFACMAEILLQLSSLKPKIAEVPMVLRYDRKKGASKMNVGPTIMNTLRLVARLRLKKD